MLLIILKIEKPTNPTAVTINPDAKKRNPDFDSPDGEL